VSIRLLCFKFQWWLFCSWRSLGFKWQIEIVYRQVR